MAGGMNAGSVYININGDSTGFNESVKKVKDGLNSLGQKIANFTSIAANISIVGTVATRAFSSVMSGMSEFGKAGDQLDKMSQRTGVSAESLSALGYAAEQNGASLDDLKSSLKYLNRNLVTAADGGKAINTSLKKIGLSFDDLNSLSKEEQFKKIADGIKDLGTEAEQTSIIMDLFGRGSTTLLPMLQKGANGISKMTDEARDLGITMSNDAAKKASLFSSAMTRLQKTFVGVKNAVMGAVAPALTYVFDGITKLVQVVRNFFQTNEFFLSWFTTVKNVFMLIGGIVYGVATNVFTFFQSSVGGVFSTVTGYFKSFHDKFNNMFGGMTDLVAEGRFEDAFNLAWLYVKLAWETGMAWLNGYFDQIYSAVAGPFEAAANAVYAVIGPLWDWIVESSKRASDTTVSIWTDSLGGLGDFFTKWWKAIVDGWDALINDIGEVIAGFRYFFLSAWNEISSLSQHAWNQALSGIQIAFLETVRFIAKQAAWLWAKLTMQNPADVINQWTSGLARASSGVAQRRDEETARIEKGKQDYYLGLEQSTAGMVHASNQAKERNKERTARQQELAGQIAAIKATIGVVKEEIVNEAGRQIITPVQEAKAISSGTFSAFGGESLGDTVLDRQLAELVRLNETLGLVEENTRETDEQQTFVMLT